MNGKYGNVVTPKEIKKHKIKKIDLIFIVVMLSIPILHYCIFFLYVNFDSFCLAFQLPTGEWSLETFKAMWREIFQQGAVMNIAIRNTLLFFLKDMLVIPFQVLIAYFLYKKIKCQNFFRIMFYIPSLISGVVMTTMFMEFIGSDGPLGILLKAFGMRRVPNFIGQGYAIPTIMFYTIWTGWGGNMLLFSGALARIPTEVLEAARIDGVTPWREFTFMIVPLIWPTIGTLYILSMTGLFNAGGPILLFTGGKYDTYTINYWIFDKLKYNGVGAYNSVAATGMIFAAFGVPVLLLSKWLVEKVPTVEY